ncbi:MAG: glycosyltransferase family 4 protein [Planctomycetes bacterium]|nr:glycosyltransferase family 4 protein [Planctomycetota bacterium]
MRAIVNATSTIGNLTGVGRYTNQLMECLPKLSQADQFFFYPHACIRSLRHTWKKASEPDAGKPVVQDVKKSRNLPNPRKWLRSGLLPCAHLFLWLYSRAVVSKSWFDLYHETNYIPIACSIPTVTTFHDLSIIHHPEWHPKKRVDWFNKYLPRTYSQTRHFITDTESVRREMIETLNIPPEKITRIWCGIRSDLQRVPKEEYQPVLQRLGLPDSFLLHVGTMEPRKNLFMLMKAYVDLPTELREKCPLVLIGQWGWNYGEAAEFYQSIARHQNVKQIGYVSDDDLPALYSAARSLVFPTHYEGFGIPPLEMMGCGGAVIGSTAASVAEVTAGHAFLIDPDDVAGWRDAMKRAITDDDWLKTLRKGVVEHARQFTWERTAEETLRVYRRVLGIDKTVAKLPASRAA